MVLIFIISPILLSNLLFCWLLFDIFASIFHIPSNICLSICVLQMFLLVLFHFNMFQSSGLSLPDLISFGRNRFASLHRSRLLASGRGKGAGGSSALLASGGSARLSFLNTLRAFVPQALRSLKLITSNTCFAACFPPWAFGL